MSRPKVKPSPKNPARNKQNQQQTNPSLAIHEHHEGPIPPPAMMQEYDQITPGAANRLLLMAEAEAKHRHSIESLATNSNIEDR